MTATVAIMPVTHEPVSTGGAGRHGRRDTLSGRMRLLVAGLLSLAVCLIVTPFVLQGVSQLMTDDVVRRAQEQANTQSAAVRRAELRRAYAYNRRLVGSQTVYGTDPSADYLAQLDSQSVMATVSIPAISVEVPVYHTTDDESLSLGAGHLYGTSLPVGGRSTHSVIAAHNGNPSSRLFTNLSQLRDGDVFSVSVEGGTLWYRVDSELTVRPEQVVDHVAIRPGEDRVTLLTCTPYGINTHRLLVSGVRTAAPSGPVGRRFAVDPMFPVAVGLLVVIAVIVVMLLSPWRQARHAVIGGRKGGNR